MCSSSTSQKALSLNLIHLLSEFTFRSTNTVYFNCFNENPVAWITPNSSYSPLTLLGFKSLQWYLPRLSFNGSVVTELLILFYSITVYKNTTMLESLLMMAVWVPSVVPHYGHFTSLQSLGRKNEFT
jgi:hypothetical protein